MQFTPEVTDLVLAQLFCPDLNGSYLKHPCIHQSTS